MGLKFEKLQVSQVKPQLVADGSVVLKISTVEGFGIKIPVEDAAAKKIRPGVAISGFFSRQQDWSLDTDDGDKLKGSSLVGANITKVEKGEFIPPELSDEIQDVDWAAVKPKDAYVAKPKPGAGAAQGGKAGGAAEEVSDVVE